MKILRIFTILILLLNFIGCQQSGKNQNEEIIIQKWDAIELSFQGPLLDENSDNNPFLDYRLDVEFSNRNSIYVVPGYFAADGNAAETGATKGSVWKVKFSPDKLGEWNYKVHFRKGGKIAVDDNPESGKPVFFDGKKGSFLVVESGKKSPDLRSKGRLEYVGNRYLQWAETGEAFLKGGADSPENFLAYSGFDKTYNSKDSLSPVKTYSEHVKDWQEGDPIWHKEKGKGIIGAVNYLASKGMNSIYFLTMNINGDGKDVWPYISPVDLSRFDCSKLDQWDIVFSHMQNKGIIMHVVTQETENELLLDNGNTGVFRKLYYRELIARFGYHQAIIWNLGEENGVNKGNPTGQSDDQRRAMATFFKKNDPYKHPVVIHTWSREVDREKIYAPLLGFKDLDGPSLQVGDLEQVHDATKKWIKRSVESGKQWFVCLDENGSADVGALPDKDDPDHNLIRTYVLWANLMAGGSGVEWYFGYKYVHSDLSCQDWRTRDLLWEQTKIAIDFFQNNIPFQNMSSSDELVKEGNAWCFADPGETFLIYKWGDKNIELDLKDYDSDFVVKYFNPKSGEWSDKIDRVDGGNKVEINTKGLLWKNSDVAILVSKE